MTCGDAKNVDTSIGGDSEETTSAEVGILPPGIDESRPYTQNAGVLIDFKRMTEILIKNLGSTAIVCFLMK
jgi:hypothetical protein